MALVATVPLAAHARYPQDALRCIASLKEPDGMLICPKHRFVIYKRHAARQTGQGHLLGARRTAHAWCRDGYNRVEWCS